MGRPGADSEIARRRTAYYRTQTYLYQVTEHRVYEGESHSPIAQIGVTQFMNSATPGTRGRNNCTLKWFPDPEHPGMHVMTAQVTAVTVVRPQLFLAHYGTHRKPVPEVMNLQTGYRPPSAFFRVCGFFQGV